MSRKLVEPLETAPLLKYCSYCSHFCCREMTEEKGRGLLEKSQSEGPRKHGQSASEVGIYHDIPEGGLV